MARKKGPICVSVINMKGGVGKTTVAALLSRYASRYTPLNTLTIDIDPQANLSQALMREQRYRQFLDNKSPSIVDIFTGYLPPTKNTPSPSPLNISDVVVDIETSLQIIPSKFDFSDHLINSLKPDPRVLARLITKNFRHMDLIIIDCAPTESIFTQAAYYASRYILVPVRPEYFATVGFPLLNDSLSAFKRKNRSHSIDVIGVVINNAFYDGGNDGGPEKTRAMREIREEARKNRWHIFSKEIPHSRGFPKMMRGDYAHLGNAYKFNLFAMEFFSKLQS